MRDRSLMTPLPRLLAPFAALVLAATGCSVAFADAVEPIGGGEFATIQLAGDTESACDSGLTDDGTEMLTSGSSASRLLPSYELDVDIDPVTGSVAGSMVATIVADDDEMRFRAFAGLDEFDAGMQIIDVTVNGQPVEAELDQSLLSLANPAGANETVTIELDFSYAVDQRAANEDLLGGLTGESLQADQVGLLGRTETGMQLGHWFPVWLPNGTRTDPDPAGFGDIGGFPAAAICATITAPDDYRIVTGGMSDGSALSDSGTITEGATGLRDFAILISNDLEMVKGTVDGVEVRVWGPSDDRESLQTVLDYSLASQEALVEAFGPYPWREIDVVSAPLGGGVGGMEWPGMVWIERSMFAGGLPGLGSGGLGGILGDLFGSDLGSMLGDDAGLALDTTLEWVIAHELGHEWWHALVGNDSIASPAVDEPLAQFAACIAMQQIHPDNWRAICEAQTLDQYAQARALGIADAPADQASDEFDSAIQYGAIVYGKAPGFYFEAGDLLGWDQLTAALRSYVAENNFTLVSTQSLREHLVDAAGDQGPTIDALWQKWFSEARGDEDIAPSDIFGGFGAGDLSLDDLFGGLGDGELNLDDLFGGLGDGELNLDDLFGNDLFSDGELNLDDLLSDDALPEEFRALLEELFGTP